MIRPNDTPADPGEGSAADAGATQAARQMAQVAPPVAGAQAPPSLNPRSASCWIPALLAVAVIVLAWLGVQKIVASTGPWAIQAARSAVDGSGLGAVDRDLIAREIDRLESALDDERIDARQATEGIDGVLQQPLIQLLTLEDARTRMLPAVGLDSTEAAPTELTRADKTLATLASYVDGDLIRLDALIEILGPLAVETDAGAIRPIASAAELREIIAAADQAIKAVDEKTLEAADLRDIDRATLTSDLTQHIDAIIDANE